MISASKAIRPLEKKSDARSQRCNRYWLTIARARPARSLAWASCNGYVTSVDIALAVAPNKKASQLGNPTGGFVRLPPAPPPPPTAAV